MPVDLEPVRAFPCTYADCPKSFDSLKEMKRHKKNSEEHDYCHKCDKDCKDPQDLFMHRALRPDNHGKACRTCGEEFKSVGGLKLHVELSHRVDQKLPCIGCSEQFPSATLLTEHLEYGHCPTITSTQFQGHIVHKYLVAELLKGDQNYDRFMQKISKHAATQDKDDVEGGINLMDQDEDEARNVPHPAIMPVVTGDCTDPPAKLPEAWPSLPPHGSKEPIDLLTGSVRSPSINGEQSDSASRASGITTPTLTRSYTSKKTPKAWGSGNAWASGSTTSSLFPEAMKHISKQSTNITEQYDKTVEQKHGINILNTRFWDPSSPDYDPERFYEPTIQEYYCPFICEQRFAIPADLNRHIMTVHRITTMRCPSCLKIYQSCTQLVAHCESRGSKCKINQAEDYNKFLDRLTGGFLSVSEETRPDYLHNPPVLVENQDTGEMERYQAPTISYLQYTASTPVDYREPQERTIISHW